MSSPSPSPSPAPPPLSSLIFLSSTLPSSPQNQSQLLSSLKKSHLTLTNRLQSIRSDAAFVRHVAASNPGLAVVSNERAGGWYVDPQLKRERIGGETAEERGKVYFKSTDGHHGQWGFSLRRLNLHLLSTIADGGGCIIVDSTRRGKSTPDALSKTVPIWVAVFNRVLFPEMEGAHGLSVPVDVVGGSEKGQIEGRLEGWAGGLRGLKLDLEKLRLMVGRPMRVEFVTRESEIGVERVEGWHTVVCCSASRRERGDGDSYVQGAGDDTENWARGLTADMFWRHYDELLGVSGEELRETVDRVVREGSGSSVGGVFKVTPPGPSLSFFVGVQEVLMAIDLRRDFDAVVDCGMFDQASLIVNEDAEAGGPSLLQLGCPSGKIGSILSKNTLPRILFVCSSGKDFSIGVALAFFCMYFDDEGRIVREPRKDINKSLIRQRLAIITEAVPSANPSRATLQSVNTLLMAQPGL